MAKSKKTFRYCEHCDTAIEYVSPPADSQYKEGVIFIDSGVILLDNSDDPDKSHAINIGGTYCGILCLGAHLNNLRKIN